MSNKIRILVPVDFSEASVLASKYAVEVAYKLNAGITFLHAFYSPAFDLVELVHGKQKKELKEDVIETAKIRAEKELSIFKNILAQEFEPREINELIVEELLVPDLADKAIFSYVLKDQPDLVIMGSHGKTSADMPIMGSITKRVIQKIKVPVLVVPADYTFVGLENVKNVLFLTEFDENDFGSIHMLSNIMKNFKISLHCLHMGKKASETKEKEKMDLLTEYFQAFYPEADVKCFISEGTSEPLTEINHFIIEEDIKLLALTTKKRNLIKRLFKKDFTDSLFYHTNIPLLFFHS